MGEREKTFRRAGKYVGSGTSEQVFDQMHPFLRPMEEVDFDKSTAGLLERSNLIGCQRSGIPVYGDDRMPGSEQQRSCSLFSKDCARGRSFPDEVIEGFAPALGGETLQGNNAFFYIFCEKFANDQ
jgi:hypothetical protein